MTSEVRGVRNGLRPVQPVGGGQRRSCRHHLSHSGREIGPGPSGLWSGEERLAGDRLGSHAGLRVAGNPVGKAQGMHLEVMREEAEPEVEEEAEVAAVVTPSPQYRWPGWLVGVVTPSPQYRWPGWLVGVEGVAELPET